MTEYRLETAHDDSPIIVHTTDYVRLSIGKGTGVRHAHLTMKKAKVLAHLLLASVEAESEE